MKQKNNLDIISFKKNEKKKINILGFSVFSIIMILFLIIIHIFLSYDSENKKINSQNWHNFMSMLLFVMVFSGILKFIGSNFPIIKNIGGGPILCILVPAFIFNYNFGFPTFTKFQKTFINQTSFFSKNAEGIGFLDFFVTSLVVGSLVGIKKEFLGRMLKRFLPLVIITLIISALFAGIIGLILEPIKGLSNIKNSTRNSFLDSIFYIFFPIACGGFTCGIIPLTKIFSQGNIIYEDAFKDHILPSLLIAGIFSVILSGLIKKFFGKSKYSSPNKIIEKNIKILENDKNINQGMKNTELNINYSNISTGLISIFSFYILSSLLRIMILKLFSIFSFLKNIENYLPPVIVFLVILVIIVKILNLVSFYYEKCIEQASQFITNNFTSSILCLVGIGTNINKIIDSIYNLHFLLTCILCVIITSLTAAIIGNKFGYYPVQSAISAGLCSNSIGGAGNMAILEASDSMELMPYAQISTRMGGDIIVILASIFFPLFYQI
ncbi:2-hydroxycarboxylate symporter MleP [Candidatus Phytoplasma rubi]|uniref:2-hydroxycarboxylate symporter MleP n=1 Tax=Candidatus Phytoplasma rubi TaxID=399025 RepID=A0ABY7BSL5_9MOLU|nr:2-hydroxycarboxylate transporter family protein [Candidatus Phytoplasma rubi]WAN63378.1 2-hydroxycarboxylate symporter MleP [Candidatus Phytoplasma rubi]